MITQPHLDRGVISPVSQHFPARMAAHLRRHFPSYCFQLGPRVTRQAILEGIEKATQYEINGDRALCLFIDLLFAFGPDFDTEKEYSWTHEILRDYSIDSDTKMRRIYGKGLSMSRLHRSG